LSRWLSYLSLHFLYRVTDQRTRSCEHQAQAEQTQP
jgi:hypothetical protein